MTPAEFKAARQALGLSQNALARALRVESGRTVRRWEAGERDIPGPAEVAIGYMLQHGLRQEAMSPDHFAAEMAALHGGKVGPPTRDGTGYPTETHIAMDELMCELLRELGYGAGIDYFDKQDKWYE